MSMKDKVNIEGLIVYEPFWDSQKRKKECSICNEFSNIHCVNCKDNIWLCIDFWQYYKVDYHKISH
jgi:hypothetical protein